MIAVLLTDMEEIPMPLMGAMIFWFIALLCQGNRYNPFKQRGFFQQSLRKTRVQANATTGQLLVFPFWNSVSTIIHPCMLGHVCFQNADFSILTTNF